MNALLQEKADQAHAIMKETGLDCWLTFVRETDIHPDPGISMVVGADVVRNSAFILSAAGRRTGIVANFDVAEVRDQGVFNEVIGYDEDIRPVLCDVLRQINPAKIGLNYSLDDQTADGLTYGHWLLLNDLLRGTPFVERLTSAAPMLARLRGRKIKTEIGRIREAAKVTEEIVRLTTAEIRPGRSEKDIGDFVHAEFRRRGLAPAWPLAACPVVNSGPHSEPGHAGPRADIIIEPGHLVHMDVGIRLDGYCSDLQRMWYVRRPGESAPPAEVQRAFASVRAAIEAGAALLKPGVRGCDVDAAARKVVVEAGYPEFKHGLGHSLGRAVHDGGTMLGPRWPCYGRMPESIVEAGNVFTLELGVKTECGFVGLEEDVCVTETGCEFLSEVQREMIVV